MRTRILGLAALLALVLAVPVLGQGKRKVIIDQDAAGPGGTDMQAILALINSPDTDVLGITVLTGDAWRDEEVLHTLRLLEIIGRTDIPVLPGAAFPLVNSKEYIAKWETLYGKVIYQGAWNYAKGHAVHGATDIPPMPEGTPTTKASAEDAAHFLVRTVRQYPHEVTIYAAGPMTNLALAIGLDPQFPELSRELIVMAGSINPQTDDPEFVNTPRHEFNLWFDPEAAHIVLMAPWKKIVCTTVDISVKTRLTQDLINRVKAGSTPAARYVGSYSRLFGQYNYLWDELAALAWLDPSLITAKDTRYLDVDLNRGAGYGNTLSWTEGDKPKIVGRAAEVQVDFDTERFYKMFVELLTAPTPKP